MNKSLLFSKKIKLTESQIHVGHHLMSEIKKNNFQFNIQWSLSYKTTPCASRTESGLIRHVVLYHRFINMGEIGLVTKRSGLIRQVVFPHSGVIRQGPLYYIHVDITEGSLSITSVDLENI